MPTNKLKSGSIYNIVQGGTNLSVNQDPSGVISVLASPPNAKHISQQWQAVSVKTDIWTFISLSIPGNLYPIFGPSGNLSVGDVNSEWKVIAERPPKDTDFKIYLYPNPDPSSEVIQLPTSATGSKPVLVRGATGNVFWKFEEVRTGLLFTKLLDGTQYRITNLSSKNAINLNNSADGVIGSKKTNSSNQKWKTVKATDVEGDFWYLQSFSDPNLFLVSGGRAEKRVSVAANARFAWNIDPKRTDDSTQKLAYKISIASLEEVIMEVQGDTKILLKPDSTRVDSSQLWVFE